jgi:hypothetical protein
MKQTTEVSGNQTPEACSSLSGVSMRQARASPIPTWWVYFFPGEPTFLRRVLVFFPKK